MSLLLGITGILIALGIAWWQYREADRAKAALHAALDAIPAKIADTLRLLVASHQKDPDTTDNHLNDALPSVVEYADVDGDGKQELLVQYPAGAHGSALKIFGWKNGEFAEIARLGVGTPVGFEFGDFDGDGRVEIKTQETDWTAGLPYVNSPRLTLLLRWNGTDFAEVAREESPY
jgi:hypothetical protein